MINVAKAAEIAVAAKIASFGIPAAERIFGFTARIYAIARKVVIPATISVLTVVPFSLSLNNFSKECSSSKILWNQIQIPESDSIINYNHLKQKLQVFIGILS